MVAVLLLTSARLYNLAASNFGRPRMTHFLPSLFTVGNGSFHSREPRPFQTSVTTGQSG
jgi:hypothetical protein